MRKIVTLMVVLGILVALTLIIGASVASAYPTWGPGGAPASCMACHKTGIPGTDGAVEAYMAVHDSSVGECMTCHTYEDESIHGKWGDTPEACARCHRTHSAVEDDLLAMGKDELCLFCHGRSAGLAQTNVLDGLLRVDSGSLRAGGFEKATMNTSTNNAASSAVGYATSTDEWYFPVSGGAEGNVTSKHTLGVEATIWGSWNAEGFSVDPVAGEDTTVLQCVSCHDPHAYGLTYRMLTRRPADSGVAKHTANDSDPWEQRVFVTDQLTYAEFNPLTDILSYTTPDYSNTEIGNKTYDVGNATWTLEKIHGTTYASPDVVDPDTGDVVEVLARGEMVPMYSQELTTWCASCHDRYHAQKVGYSTPGTNGSGDAIFDYRHKTGDDTPVWDEVDGRYETTSCGYACHNSAQLGCVSCHVAHGTTSDMTPYVTAMPWPGEGGGHYDTRDDAVSLGEGWLLEDPNLNVGNETDHDGDSRSNLLRIDNRGVCQNPACHPKGKTSYLDPYDSDH